LTLPREPIGEPPPGAWPGAVLRVTLAALPALGPLAALAGLCALSGPLHGGMAARVFNLLEESRRIGAAATVEGRLARGAPTPGFGHPLYPEGDPRAVALLAACPPTGELQALQSAVEMRTGERANIDFALVVLAETHGLPADAPFLLFAVARLAGWIAHAVEEGASGRLIRPRARYIGPPVGVAGG
jgi:citrate synthase